MDVARVQFYARPDAWDAWQALALPPDTLDMAFAELKDERLVAAYLLETVCTDARMKAAQAREQQAEAVKAVEVGPIKLQFNPASSATAETIAADDWCKRAALLRGLVAREVQVSPRRTASVVVLPELGL